MAQDQRTHVREPGRKHLRREPEAGTRIGKVLALLRASPDGLLTPAVRGHFPDIKAKFVATSLTDLLDRGYVTRRKEGVMMRWFAKEGADGNSN